MEKKYPEHLYRCQSCGRELTENNIERGIRNAIHFNYCNKEEDVLDKVDFFCPNFDDGEIHGSGICLGCDAPRFNNQGEHAAYVKRSRMPC